MYELVEQSEERVLIESGYIRDEKLFELAYRKYKSGVDVRIIIPTKDCVASQTISVTVITSSKLTTPTMSATMAPITAVVPICKPLGCHIMNTRVIKKTLNANAICLPLVFNVKIITELN